MQHTNTVNGTHKMHKRNKTYLDKQLQDKPCTNNIRLRAVRATILAAKKQELSHIL